MTWQRESGGRPRQHAVAKRSPPVHLTGLKCYSVSPLHVTSATVASHPRGQGEALSQDDGRVALVSGGSHGIGAATVRRLAARGWDISFCYREDGPSVRQIEKDASELGVRVVAIQADVTDPAQVASWFRRAEDEFGPVAAMVSCAGITRDLPLSLMAEDDWRAVIDGVFHLCLAAVSVMTKQRSGRIVVVSSVCGAYDHSAGGHDIFARPGIAGFVKALAGQTARFGVSVNAVAPGLVAHDMADLVPEGDRGDLTETIAIRRFGDAAAVADLVAFLLSEEAAGITGTVLEARSVISLLSRQPPQPQAGAASVGMVVAACTI